MFGITFAFGITMHFVVCINEVHMYHVDVA